MLHSSGHDASEASSREAAGSHQLGIAGIADPPGLSAVTSGGECHVARSQNAADHGDRLPDVRTPCWHRGHPRTGLAGRR
jgi:hypothetical protein